MPPKYKYVSPGMIGLNNDSKIAVYKKCPNFESLDPNYKDLVIYGSCISGYTICSYEDFENRGPQYSRTITKYVTYLEIKNRFENKNNKLNNMKAKHKECMDLTDDYNKQVDEYNNKIGNIIKNIGAIDNQIEALKRQLNELEKQKQIYMNDKSSLSTDRDRLCIKLGVIETKKQNLLKSIHKHINENIKIEDLVNIKEGKLYYC